MTLEEQEAMIASLKSASKSTAFAQWLGAVRSGSGPTTAGSGSPPAAAGPGPASGAAARAAAGAAGSGSGTAGDAVVTAPSHQEEMAAVLAEVAEYLAQQDLSGSGGRPATLTITDPASIAADSSSFK